MRKERGRARFAEGCERDFLVLVWEWFLLEVAGAAPPALLWATEEEPILVSVRPLIRTALASLEVERGKLMRRDEQLERQIGTVQKGLEKLLGELHSSA